MITRCRRPHFLTKFWGLAAVASLFTFANVSTAFSQDLSPTTKRSGIWYGGQYFGFDPQRARLASEEQPLVDEAQAPSGEEPMAPGEMLPRNPDVRSFETDECCADSQMCAPPSKLWARGEFLLWWMKGMNLPPLATTDPNGGVLPNATVLFGGSTVNEDILPGGRFTLGLWTDECNSQGIEASYMFLSRASAGFNGSSATFEVLARPFTDVNPDSLGATADVIVSEGNTTGTLAISATSQLHSFDILWRWNLGSADCCTTDLMVGFRHAQLIDSILINETILTTGTAAPGTSTALFDQFGTRNTFNGAEFGIFFQRRLNDCWALDLTAKGALGQVNSSIGIAGQTRTTPAAGTSTFADVGLLAQTTNSGQFSQSEFTAIGDFSLNLRRELPCGWRANLGYSLIVWGDVLRAGDQIDLNVNTSQIPPGALTGDPRPLVPFASTNFWAHGLQIGVQRSF